jgi:hypothetical protein
MRTMAVQTISFSHGIVHTLGCEFILIVTIETKRIGIFTQGEGL